jgi:hypothetical protein
MLRHPASIGTCCGQRRSARSMSERSCFDLHLAECTAQSAAIWLVLEAMLRFQLRDTSAKERAKFFGQLLKAAETITLPVGKESDQAISAEWIAHRYWELINNFLSREPVWDLVYES